MQIWPAIDISAGKCVRLRQGDFAQETVFSDDPPAVAAAFMDQGARRIHVVDLDGARDGVPRNMDIIERIRERVPLRLQMGGGLRDTASVRRVFELGIDRVVVGTAAILHPDLLPLLATTYPHRISFGMDVRGGDVAIHGWQHASGLGWNEVLLGFESLPLASVVVTDIATDGMLEGPNLETIRAVQGATPHPVVASGGVTTVDDLMSLLECDVAGAIVGRAIYEGRLGVAEAVRTAGDAGD